MKVFAVNYDLRKPGKDYKGLHEELKNSPDWWHYLGSTWLIASSETAAQLYERLRLHFDRNDRLLIIEVGADYRCRSFIQNAPCSGSCPSRRR